MADLRNHPEQDKEHEVRIYLLNVTSYGLSSPSTSRGFLSPFPESSYFFSYNVLKFNVLYRVPHHQKSLSKHAEETIRSYSRKSSATAPIQKL